MKIKDNYILRRVADTWVVFPIGVETVDFNGMLRLNESGAVIWRELEKGCSRERIADVLSEEYDVTSEQALVEISVFLNRLMEIGCVEE